MVQCHCGQTFTWWRVKGEEVRSDDVREVMHDGLDQVKGRRGLGRCSIVDGFLQPNLNGLCHCVTSRGAHLNATISLGDIVRSGYGRAP